MLIRRIQVSPAPFGHTDRKTRYIGVLSRKWTQKIETEFI